MGVTQQYLWPLLGVLLGWLLSVLSGGWAARSERKKLVGRLLARLIGVSDDLRTLNLTSEYFKDIAGGIERYEKVRQRVYTLHFLDSAGKAAELPNLISDLATVSPLEATDLNKVLHTLLKSKDLKLDASSKDQDTYIKLLSMHEVGIDACDKKVTEIVTSLAWKHGLITRMKLALRRRRVAEAVAKNHPVLDKMGKEILGEIRDRA